MTTSMKPPSFLLVSLLLAFVTVASLTEAFVPSSNLKSARRSLLFRSYSSTELSSASPSTGLPFDDYSQTDPNQGLEYKDTLIGTGDAVETGKVLTVAYKGRIMSNNEQFDEGESYSFRLGQRRVLPGWEQGVIGMRVGGKRTLRIPPKLGFGDRWVKGTIPPNSHVEFDMELKSIAQNQLEETWVQLNVGTGRAVTAVVLILILAISPALS